MPFGFILVPGIYTLVSSAFAPHNECKFARSWHSRARGIPRSMAGELSEYELQRLENIRRNQKVLESLGLVSRDAELHQDMRKCDPRAKKQKAAPATEGGAEDARAAVRRSHRLAGRPAEATDVDGGAGGAGDTLSGEHGRARDDYEAAWARRWSGRQASTTPAGTCADMCRGVRAVPEAQGSLPQGATQGTYTYRPRACPVCPAPQVGTVSVELP